MKCSPVLQRLLLDLADVDAAIVAAEHRNSEPSTDRHVKIQQRHYFEARSTAARARLALEDFERELQRARGELAFLERRQAHDEEAVHVAHETEVLRDLYHDLHSVERLLTNSRRRIRHLEEQVSAYQAQVANCDAAVKSTQRELDSAVAALDKYTADVASALPKMRAEREALVESLPSYVVDVYEEIREERGVGAGRLIGPNCGVCRMDLSTGQLHAIHSAPPDELVRCPECGGLLARSDLMR